MVNPISTLSSSIATFSARGGSTQNYIKVPLIAVPEAAQVGGSYCLANHGLASTVIHCIEPKKL